MVNESPGEASSPFSDEALRRIAKEKVILAFFVKVHILAYICVNAFLVLLDYFITSPGSIDWAIIVASSWLVGLGIHVGGYLIYARGVIGGNKKGLLFHFIAEAFSVQAVIVINLLTSPWILWLVWPLGAMAGAVIVHLILFNWFLKGKASQGKKSWMDRKIDEELKKAGRQK
ncbi:MAG: 2TM domain-containing protein [Candidatus Lokiarchaeota archaeon]|nr:2TM domain-containing protein [Candidatus Lokiarchaeota archaeon]